MLERHTPTHGSPALHYYNEWYYHAQQPPQTKNHSYYGKISGIAWHHDYWNTLFARRLFEPYIENERRRIFPYHNLFGIKAMNSPYINIFKTLNLKNGPLNQIPRADNQIP